MGPRIKSPLLAVLLVTSSSRGATLTFQYPRRPKVEKRYSQVRYHVGGEEEKNHFRLHEDEMEDEFESEMELSDDDGETEESDSDASELNLSDDRSDWDTGQSRREFEVASSAGGTGVGVKSGAAATDQEMKRTRAYQQYLGYDTDILASILAPKRELCHRKFELVIDDLAFVGHPVCVDKDGHWDVEAQQIARGRDQKKKGEDGGYIIGDSLPEPTATSLDKSAKAPMSLFHFVLVLDRPDPSPHIPTVDLTSWLQMFYDNIAFKTTAALFAEEVRCEYVTQESEKLGVLRDRCMDDAQSYSSFLTQELHYSSLARSLQQIYSSISLSANAFITVNDNIEVHLQLPPILHDPTRMMRIADVETPIDANDAVYSKGAASGPVDVADLIFEEWTRTTGPFLLPWKTLLLLNGDENQNQERDPDEVSNVDMAAEQRIDSWAKKFTSLLKPTLEGIPTFAELADLLDWSLEDDVYPMVRHLIYYREARVIDVPRIQNFYAISPLFDLANLPSLSTSWSITFPTLSPLVSFLAKLSSALKPFSVQCRKDERLLCLGALVWLLRHQVVVQMHVRLRLIAKEEAKRQAAELRKTERTRVYNQQQKRLAKKVEADKKRQEAEAVAQTNFIQTSSILSISAPADVAPAGEALERGRLRDRSTSPLSASVTRQQEQQENSTFASALSATRPDLPTTSPKYYTNPAISSTGPSTIPAINSLVEELSFERRPVLRSRSPSKLLAAASERSLSNRGSGSRPSTPRGRGRLTGHSREHSANVSTELLQQGLQQQQPQSAPTSNLKHRPSRREGRASNSSRSPSRARMRVTGFGEGEEVFVEIEGAADSAAKEASQTVLSAEAEGRRLSRVGEEVEGDSSALLGERTGTLEPTSEHGGNDEREEEHHEGKEESAIDDEEEEEEEDGEEAVEIEDWETHPKATIISEPSRANGEENEWIAVMVQGRPPWLTQRLFNLLPFLNGKHTIDEIVHRLDWRRKDLRAVLVAFKEEILTLVHP